MKYEVKTKQGTNFIVDDDSIELWLEIEERFDLTFYEAQQKLSRQSLATLTKLFFTAAVIGGHTEYKTHKTWVKEEFDSFEIAGEADPKAEAEL